MDKQQFELHTQVENHHWWFVARRRIVSKLLAELVEPSKSNKVVEIGMGTGGNMKSLAKSYDCVGIEVDAHAAQFAREQLQDEAVVCEGDALTTHSEHVRTADAILLLDVIEHIEDDNGFLNSVIDLMSPGAHLLITVPACPWLWSPHDDNHYHYRRYLPETLQALWQGRNVREHLLDFFNARLYAPVRAIRLWNKFSGNTRGDAGTDLSVPPPFINSMLERTFRGESKHLINSIHNPGKRVNRRGVSVIAVLEKTTETAPALNA